MEKTLKILKTLNDNCPSKTTNLRFSNPLELLIAAMLSSQSTDKQVNRVTARLFKKYRSIEEFSSADPEKLAEEIKECGLNQRKSRNIIAACRMIREKFKGEVPQKRAELLQLPGVGRKTANVVLSNAFGIPALAVDTHVFRVSHRLGLAFSKTADGTEKELCELIPLNQWSAAHHWLIYHGRKFCLARNPCCGECPVGKWCPKIF